MGENPLSFTSLRALRSKPNASMGLAIPVTDIHFPEKIFIVESDRFPDKLCEGLDKIGPGIQGRGTLEDCKTKVLCNAAVLNIQLVKSFYVIRNKGYGNYDEGRGASRSKGFQHFGQ
jgi:hypothetical protein